MDAIDRVVELLIGALEAERFIYVMGNGGSAANAEHFADDLGKGEARRFPRRFKVCFLGDEVEVVLTGLGLRSSPRGCSAASGQRALQVLLEGREFREIQRLAQPGILIY